MLPKYRLIYSKDRVVEAKERLKAAFEHRITDRVPFIYEDAEYFYSFSHSDWSKDNEVDGLLEVKGFSFSRMATDDEWVLENQIKGLNNNFKRFPDTDRIPYLTMTETGNAVIASMFGAEVTELESQHPTVKGRIIKDLEEDLMKIPHRINPYTDGLGPRCLKRLKFFLEATEGGIPCQVLDHGSPFVLATFLMDPDQLIMEMYDHPELVKKFLGITTQAIIDVIDAQRKTAGDPQLIIGNPFQPDFHDHAIVWDDYVSVLNPEMWLEFCREPNERIYNKCGSGHLHTCGPYLENYLEPILKTKGVESIDLNASLRETTRTKEDLLTVKEMIKGKIVGIGSLSEIVKVCPGRSDLIRGREYLNAEFLRKMNEQGGFVWTEICTPEESERLLGLAKYI